MLLYTDNGEGWDLALPPRGRRLALFANSLACPLTFEVRAAQQTLADFLRLSVHLALFVFGR